MRCLGIDYGEKRIGLSYGDETGVAVPVPPATEKRPEARWAAVAKAIQERGITDIVVGYPYNMDGTAGFKAREVDGFIAGLEKRFGLPVHRVDERLTTYQAESDQPVPKRKRGGPRQARRSGAADSRAATLILQDFFDQRHRD